LLLHSSSSRRAPLQFPGALIAVDDPDFGPASFTRDTKTSLEWLDLRFTAGKSFREVTEALAIGEQFYGLSLASIEDVDAFFVHGGATIGTAHGAVPGDPAYDAVSQLIDLVGALSVGSDSRSSLALTSSQRGAAGLRARSALQTVFPPSACCESLASAFPFVSTVGDEFGDPTQGAWLIREFKPSILAIAPSAGLIVLALAAALIVNRRKMRPSAVQGRQGWH
jgi:hypothetical protein